MNDPLIGITSYELTVKMQPPFKMAGVNIDYKDAVIRAGGIPVLIPQNILPDQIPTLLDRLDGVVMSGGGDVHPRYYGEEVDHPRVRGIDVVRDETERRIACYAVEHDIPLLAICRGHQMLNVALGGSLWQDVETLRPETEEHDFYKPHVGRDFLAHTIDIEPSSKLVDLVGGIEIKANSIHHQAIRELGEGLVVTGRSADASIEAVERPDKTFVVGIQWHPENIQDTVPAMRGLFVGLVEAARAVNSGR